MTEIPEVITIRNPSSLMMADISTIGEATGLKGYKTIVQLALTHYAEYMRAKQSMADKYHELMLTHPPRQVEPVFEEEDPGTGELGHAI